MAQGYEFPMFLWAALLRFSLLVKRYCARVKSYFLCAAYGIAVRDKRPLFFGRTILRTRRRGDITIGPGCVFDADVVKNLVGLSGPTILDTRHGGQIHIGEDSGFSAVVMSSKQEIQIGSRVKCGGNVRIFDHDFHSLSPETRAVYDLDVANIRSKSVFIGDDVFIGTNAMILKGSRIGCGTIVAAGAVVFGLDVPPNSLVKGNPAFIVEKR